MFCTYKNNFLYIIHYYIIMLLLLYYLHTKDIIIRSILYCHQRNNKNKHLWEKYISYCIYYIHVYIYICTYIYNIVDTIYIIIIVRLPRYNITLNNYVCKWYRYLFLIILCSLLCHYHIISRYNLFNILFYFSFFFLHSISILFSSFCLFGFWFIFFSCVCVHQQIWWCIYAQTIFNFISIPFVLLLYMYENIQVSFFVLFVCCIKKIQYCIIKKSTALFFSFSLSP